MSKLHFKLSLIALLGFILVAFTHCGDPFKTQSALVFEGNIYGGEDPISYEAFSSSVYQLTRTHCVACHTTTQPVHASPSLVKAHNAVISQFKVNFANLPASRIVAKIRDENHHCWGDCASNAQEMLAALKVWHEAIKESAPAPTTPVDTDYVTSQTRALEIELNDSSNPLKSNSVNVPVDTATRTAPMVMGSDIDGSFIWVPEMGQASLGATATNAGRANFSFRVPVTGSYTIWMLSKALTTNDNSYYITVPTASPAVNARSWDSGNAVSSQAIWRKVTGNNFNLSAGNHTMELRQREDGFKIYRIIVTSDTTFSGIEVDDFFGVTLEFDVGSKVNVPGASFKIDVTDYDLYSYKFSNPRMLTPGPNLLVKGIKLLLNGVWNPQHSTYTLVDRVVTGSDGKLSDFSMLALKDQGSSVDKVSFSFEKLEVTTLTGTTTGGGGGGGGGGGDSLGAFTASVYPISRNNCISCHTTRFPKHANDNSLTAHDDLLNGSYIDFDNPANSFLVRRVSQQRHNCGSNANCDIIANQFIQAIQEWKAGR